jgi:hypothetical protein
VTAHLPTHSLINTAKLISTAAYRSMHTAQYSTLQLLHCVHTELSSITHCRSKQSHLLAFMISTSFMNRLNCAASFSPFISTVFRANSLPLFLCVTTRTVPKLPAPSALPCFRSYTCSNGTVQMLQVSSEIHASARDMAVLKQAIRCR